MIIKIVPGKGKMSMKYAKSGDEILYVSVVIDGKPKQLLVKGIAMAKSKYKISAGYLPYVFGEVIFYTPHPGSVQNIKFRIKGIDKFKPTTS